MNSYCYLMELLKPSMWGYTHVVNAELGSSAYQHSSCNLLSLLLVSSEGLPRELCATVG